jgi:hypothetical protein
VAVAFSRDATPTARAPGRCGGTTNRKRGRPRPAACRVRLTPCSTVRERARVGDRHEIAQVPQLHSLRHHAARTTHRNPCCLRLLHPGHRHDPVSAHGQPRTLRGRRELLAWLRSRPCHRLRRRSPGRAAGHRDRLVCHARARLVGKEADSTSTAGAHGAVP